MDPGTNPNMVNPTADLEAKGGAMPLPQSRIEMDEDPVEDSLGGQEERPVETQEVRAVVADDEDLDPISDEEFFEACQNPKVEESTLVKATAKLADDGFLTQLKMQLEAGHEQAQEEQQEEATPTLLRVEEDEGPILEI